MFPWMIQNIATILISAALVFVVAAVIAGMIRGKKRGKSSCGCGCAGCQAGSCRAMNDVYHPAKPETLEK